MPDYKEMIRNILGEIPLTAEFYYELKKKNQPFTRYSLKNIQANLPQMLKDIEAGKRSCDQPKKIFVLLPFITGSNMPRQSPYISVRWGIR